MVIIVVNLDGDRASARSYVDAVVLGPGGRGGAHAVGFYDDKLVLGADGWRIAQRRHTSIRLKFLGLLSCLPSALALPLAGVGSRRLNQRAQAGFSLQQ